MNFPASPQHCLNCARSEQEVPLETLRYGGEVHWICSQCFPLLIHHPEQLGTKLPQAKNLTPAPDDTH